MNRKDTRQQGGNLLAWVCVMLACLMWYSHTDIFQRLEAYNGKELTAGLQCLNTFLALGFSILTAICIRKIEEYKYAALFGAFDGFAIFLHFQSNISPVTFNWVGSTFLGSLMFFLVSMIWKLAEAQRMRETAEMEARPEPKAEAKPEIQETKPVLPAVAEQPGEPEGDNVVQTTLIISKREKQYTTLNSLQGAINKNKDKIEYYFNRATPDVQAEFLSKHPEITVNTAEQV